MSLQVAAARTSGIVTGLGAPTAKSEGWPQPQSPKPTSAEMAVGLGVMRGLYVKRNPQNPVPTINVPTLSVCGFGF